MLAFPCVVRLGEERAAVEPDGERTVWFKESRKSVDRGRGVH